MALPTLSHSGRAIYGSGNPPSGQTSKLHFSSSQSGQLFCGYFVDPSSTSTLKIFKRDGIQHSACRQRSFEEGSDEPPQTEALALWQQISPACILAARLQIKQTVDRCKAHIICQEICCAVYFERLTKCLLLPASHHACCLSHKDQDPSLRAGQTRAEQNRTEQNRTEQNRTEQTTPFGISLMRSQGLYRAARGFLTDW